MGEREKRERESQKYISARPHIHPQKSSSAAKDARAICPAVSLTHSPYDLRPLSMKTPIITRWHKEVLGYKRRPCDWRLVAQPTPRWLAVSQKGLVFRDGSRKQPVRRISVGVCPKTIQSNCDMVPLE